MTITILYNGSLSSFPFINGFKQGDSEQEEDDKKILKPILALPYNFAKKPKKEVSFHLHLLNLGYLKQEGIP